ncbi:hypothetical protein BDQ17DRAFT_521972 [Cyathus striatus]|nr:hypothetical protein BDQ17DRAFT_521972 [Cyathus striatus]
MSGSTSITSSHASCLQIIQRCCNSTDAIAGGKHPGVIHAKSVTIQDRSRELSLHRPPRKDSVFQLFSQYRRKVKKLLSVAISTFKNATSVTWMISDNSLDWSRDCVISGISFMPSLKTNHGLGVCLQTLPSLNVQFFEGSTYAEIQGIPELIEKSSGLLRGLEFHSNSGHLSLEHLLSSVSTPLHIEHLMLSGFFASRYSGIVSHFQSLVSLSLKTYVDESLNEANSFWDALKCEKIYLKEISLNQPSDGFIQYLKSYAGLKSLSMLYSEGFYGYSDITALLFYTGALSSHCNTLEKLSILPFDDGGWCFGDLVIQCLEQLHELAYLNISITDNPVSYYCIFDRNYRIHGTVDNKTYPVKQLIETVSILPRLQVLSIHRTYGHFCGMDMCKAEDERTIPMQKDIDMQVTTYGPLNPAQYRFDIRNEHIYYKLKRRENGEFWYQN